MSDTSVSTVAAAAGDSGAESGAPLVVFADNEAAASEFTPVFAEEAPTDWAFSAHESVQGGEAIDALRGPQQGELLPIVAAVAMVFAAEADPFADPDSDALVAMAPAPLASDGLGTEPAMGDAASGMVMWSGNEGGVGEATSDAVAHHKPDGMLALGDVAPHGFSLDWTDHAALLLS